MLKIFGFTEGSSDLDIVNLPLTIRGKGQFGNTFNVLLQVDISDARPVLQVDTSYLTNSSYLLYTIIQGYQANLSLPYPLIYAHDPVQPELDLDLRNATIADMISLSLSSNPQWVMLDVTDLSLKVKAPFLQEGEQSLDTSITLHAIDSLSGSSVYVQVLIKVARSTASELKSKAPLVELELKENSTATIPMGDLFSNTDPMVLYSPYSPDKFNAIVWPTWARLN